MQRLRSLAAREMPLPGGGRTPERHRLLAETAREDVSLSKLMEAHWDAVAILREAGRAPESGLLYAVWASEGPGSGMRVETTGEGFRLNGSKQFCSGIGLVDRALITVRDPEQLLVEVDLKRNGGCIKSDIDCWKVDAFRATQTGGVSFSDAHLAADAVLGGAGWYLVRPGFWLGACGPASCWVGGVAGLLDYALESRRDDPHTLAHLGAIEANVWGMYALLDRAGREIDAAPFDIHAAQIRALQLRHLVDQMGSEVLRSFSRAYGPHPLSMNAETSRRFQEATLYMRQSHGARDAEVLARLVRAGEKGEGSSEAQH